MEAQIALNEIPALVASNLISRLANKNIITLTGPLGTGKTTLIKEILKQLGISEIVPSPTFGYVNTYQTKNKTIHHFDLYRIHSLEDFIGAGFQDYLDEKNSIIFIEWPETIAPLLKSDKYQDRVCTICIKHIPKNSQKRLVSVIP
jgi:tRNA threonylcarbamoyladenosine biosynthesis protein TsaE